MKIQSMTVGELTGLLETVTYRPDFKLSVHHAEPWHFSAESAGPCIVLSMFVINTYHPENPKMPLTMHQRVPGFVETVEDFYDWCLGICVWFEEHESREWFKVNNIPWRNPHAYPAQPFREREVFDRVKAMRPASITGWADLMTTKESV
jgi:hypothetical protein